VLFVAITISCVEILQLFTLLGYCDVDDLILNTLGAAIGYGIQALLDRQPIL
jgi:glycopeptide antibiotics resistance protein